jgi:hypothetical protein
MECGPQDALCQLTSWLSQNDLLAPWLVEVIGRFGIHANGLAGYLAQLVRDYGQTIVGLVGVTFGIWRWWRYREHILHKRLAEYLSESDTRLTQGTAALVEMIQRPAPGQQFKDPLFIDADLRVVLRERNWDKPAYALGVAASSDWNLDRSIQSLTRRLETAGAALGSIQRQLISAYIIRGAIAASDARRTNSEEMNTRALSFFRSALSFPVREAEVTLKELEAHQLRKLGLPAAEDAYAAMLKLSADVPVERQRLIIAARAKRYLSEVTRGTAPINADRLMRANAVGTPGYPGALLLIAACEPLELWERSEKAEMHYYAAACANRLGFVQVERAQLSDASGDYRRILAGLGRRKWFRPRRYRRLRKLTMEGLRRTKAAEDGNYDLDWLP